MAGRGTNRTAAVEIDQKIDLTVNKLKNKASLQEELARIDLPVHGTIKELKKRLSDCLSKKIKLLKVKKATWC